MQERFKKLLEDKGLTATKFAALIKVNASAMSHILNGRSKPGFDVLDKIAQAFPDVNLNWLISGKGSLYNSAVPPAEKPVKKSPVQTNLWEETSSQAPPEVKKEPEPVKTPVITPAPDIVPGMLQPRGNKKIARIILFFDDGSFEDYAK